MAKHLNEAYEILFRHSPNLGLADWQIAATVLDNFNVPRLGENLAGKCIYQVIKSHSVS